VPVFYNLLARFTKSPMATARRIEAFEEAEKAARRERGGIGVSAGLSAGAVPQRVRRRRPVGRRQGSGNKGGCQIPGPGRQRGALPFDLGCRPGRCAESTPTTMIRVACSSRLSGDKILRPMGEALLRLVARRHHQIGDQVRPVLGVVHCRRRSSCCRAPCPAAW
jgi:hypothetical protein